MDHGGQAAAYYLKSHARRGINLLVIIKEPPLTTFDTLDGAKAALLRLTPLPC